MTKVHTLTVQDRRRASELAAQTRFAAAPAQAPRLPGPIKGSPADNPHVDWSNCPLAKAYPHWDEYVVDVECAPTA